MRDAFMEALRKRYEADISVAKVTIEIYLNNNHLKMCLKMWKFE